MFFSKYRRINSASKYEHCCNKFNQINQAALHNRAAFSLLTHFLHFPFMLYDYLLLKDCQLSLFTTRAGEHLSFLFVSIHLQAGESDLFSMVQPHPTGESTEVA